MKEQLQTFEYRKKVRDNDVNDDEAYDVLIKEQKKKTITFGVSQTVTNRKKNLNVFDFNIDCAINQSDHNFTIFANNSNVNK